MDSPNTLNFPTLEPRSTVPSSGGGLDIGSIIDHISDPLTPELIKAATTPIAGPHVPTMSSSLSTPVPPYQMIPMDRRPVVGAGNARARGIENAFAGVTNALGAVVTAEAQNKQGQVRDAATKVITAQQAIDEAQQQYDMAKSTGDTETMEQMQKLINDNTKTRDGVFADPKLRKALVKGFDISYTDPQSNKTEEHQAVMQAMQAAKTRAEKKAAIAALRQKQNVAAGTAAGSAFAAAQPRGLAPNTAAQQKLQLVLQGQAVQEKVLKDIMTYQASIARADAPVKAAQVRELGANYRQIQGNMQKQLDMQMQFDYKLRFLDAQTAARQQLLWQGLAIADRKEMDHLKIASTNPMEVTKMADASDREWQTNIESIQGRLTAVTNQLQTIRMTPGATKQQIQSLQDQVDATKLTLQQAQNKQAYWGGVMATYKKMAGLPDEPEPQKGGSSDASKPSANSINSYTGDPTSLINEINSGTLQYSTGH